MLIALAVLGWIVCGVLAYGLEKDWSRRFELRMKFLFKQHDVPYFYNGKSIEIGCVVVGLMGPVGLLLNVLTRLIVSQEVYLTYRMPKELRERNR